MSEEEILPVTDSIFQDIDWNLVARNKINEGMFNSLRVKYPKLYCTFLGTEDALEFYMFRPVNWNTYKNIRTKNLNKTEQQDLVLQDCLIWPQLNAIKVQELDAGIAMTLIYQILAVSNFLKNPQDALKMIIEVT